MAVRVEELKKLFEFGSEGEGRGQRQPLVIDDKYTRGFVHLLWESLQKRRSTAAGLVVLIYGHLINNDQ